MDNYSAKSLFSFAWDITDEKEWKDFAVVTDRLNFPEAATYYMSTRISYRYYESNPGGIQIAMKLFNEKSGNCSDQTSFFTYCMNKNGYYARPLNVNEINHAVSLFRDKDGQFYTHDNTRRGDYDYPIIQGPFSSTEVKATERGKKSIISNWR